jgi:hypothetical protein
VGKTIIEDVTDHLWQEQAKENSMNEIEWSMMGQNQHKFQWAILLQFG